MRHPIVRYPGSSPVTSVYTVRAAGEFLVTFAIAKDQIPALPNICGHSLHKGSTDLLVPWLPAIAECI